MARMNYRMYPTDYIQELQQQSKREKARCFLEYFNDVQFDEVNSYSFYAKSWGTKDKPKSKGTVYKWINEFSIEISKFFAYWQVKNEQHYTSVDNKSEQQVNDTKTQSEHQIDNQSSIQSEQLDSQVNDTKTQSEHQVNQDSKSLNTNNIYAESDDSANQSSSKNKKHSYSDNFEILWNRYDKKSSNKKKSQDIYLRRWKNTDLKIICEAIDKYKESIDLTYQKDFDGFLNGKIDSLIPRRAWIVDLEKKKHLGWFYDSENKFVSDENKHTTIESANIAEFIKAKRFGYVAA